MPMASSQTGNVELYIGTSGYSYPDWVGTVYPPGLKREVGGSTPELTYLSRYFNTCEINATFYRQFGTPHRKALVRRHRKPQIGEQVRLEGNWEHVADVLNAFEQYSKVIEFRHETWDDPWVLSALRQHETAWVNIDEPKIGGL